MSSTRSIAARIGEGLFIAGEFLMLWRKAMSFVTGAIALRSEFVPTWRCVVRLATICGFTTRHQVVAGLSLRRSNFPHAVLVVGNSQENAETGIDVDIPRPKPYPRITASRLD
jgi:hypothetical protein